MAKTTNSKIQVVIHVLQFHNPLNVAANETPVPSVAVVCHEKDLTGVTPQHRELDLKQLLPYFNQK